MPKSLSIFTAVAIAACMAVPPYASAQTDTPKKKTYRQIAREKREKLETQSHEREARARARDEAALREIEARKQKRAACAQYADLWSLHLLSRQRYIKECMSR